MRIQAKNTYEDGHESTIFYDVHEPDWPVGDEDWDDYFFEWTGDGHGIGNDLGMITEIVIVEAERPVLVGLKFEYGG